MRRSRIAVGSALAALVSACTHTHATAKAPASTSPSPAPSSTPASTCPSPDPTHRDSLAAAVKGAAFVRTWVLDCGGLTIEPPRGAGKLSADEAMKLMLSSPDAHAVSERYAFALGIVTAHASNQEASPRFVRRLAWVSVVGGYVSGCPAQALAPSAPSYAPSSAEQRSPTVPTGHGYNVLLLDASNSSYGIQYSEGGTHRGCNASPGTSPPLISEFLSETSLPWMLKSRAPRDIVVTVKSSACVNFANVSPSAGGNDRKLTQTIEFVANLELGDAACRGILRTQDYPIHLLYGTRTQLVHAPTGYDEGVGQSSAAPPN